MEKTTDIIALRNILNKLPKSMQPTVKDDLREIWQADTRAAAEAAMDTFAALLPCSARPNACDWTSATERSAQA